MIRALFLASHLGSGSGWLFDLLASHPRIEGFRTGGSYDHYDPVRALLARPHKDQRSNSWWMDELLYNHSLTCKPLLRCCKFVFYLAPPESALPLIRQAGYTDRYYCFRLYALCEQAMLSGGLVVVPGITTDLSPLDRVLGLRDHCSGKVPPYVDGPEAPAECRRSYEEHLGHLRESGRLVV